MKLLSTMSNRYSVSTVVLMMLLSACAVETQGDLAQGSTTSPTEAPTTQAMTEADDIPEELAATEESTPAEMPADEEMTDGEEMTEADDIIGCTRLDSENIELEIVNNSPKTSSYWLTVAYFDESGKRVADSTELVDYVRPGERTIEQGYVFETAGTTCEVIDVDRTAAESDPEELAEVSSCEIAGEDVFGDIEATISATNGTPEPSDYNVTVAFVDADGIRRGTGSAWIEVVRPGETAPSDIFTTVDYDTGFSCEVVAVDRSAS